MRHHKVPGGMKRRVLRWYDYSWSRGRIQGGGDINTALGLLPDKLKTELALHVNLSVLKKVTIFQECQPEFLHDLVLKMKAYIFTPGDLICRKGEVAREMFIIADGILDVISKTGQVLTTMKAGDFFGEIGILNLDGLNRRTADVRSVGYSELFSLSREDVLAAMKDYPEAEEILQTLGRRRLMEAKNAAKLHKLGKDQGSSLESDVTGKNIVEKLRSDVKGLKNALRRSKRGASSKDKQSILQQTSDEHDEPAHSPGPGLPPLQRVKLLKEKEDLDKQDELAAQANKQNQESEVIGAGLPLIERIKLLKQKEDGDKKAKKEQKCQEMTTRATVHTQHLGVRFENDITNEPKEAKVHADLEEVNDKIEEQAEKKKEGGRLFRDALKKFHSKQGSESSETKPSTSKSNSVPKPEVTVEKSHPEKSELQKRKDSWGILKISSVRASRPRKTKKAAHLSKSDTILVHRSEDDEVVKERSHSASPSCGKDGRKSLKYTVENLMKERRRTKSLGHPPKRVSEGTVDVNAWEFTEFTPLDRRHPENEHAQLKKYDSVHDLSREYSGPPFVKKLQILNENQKVVVLSVSLDVPDGTLDDGIALIRSQSEASATQHRSHDINRGGNTTQQNWWSGGVPPIFHGGDLKSESTHRSETVTERPSDLPLDSPWHSPESNETLERRNLKSILKRLSAEESEEGASKKINDEEMKKLLQAQTVEGYAARHSKLTKSVTFNQGTLQSPPNFHAEINEINMSPHRPIDYLGMGPDDDIFHGVIVGIKQIMQSYLDDIERRFKAKYDNLEEEVKIKAHFIDLLQSRLENAQNSDINEAAGNSDPNQDGSDAPFMRDNSFETVLGSSPPNAEGAASSSMHSSVSDHGNPFRDEEFLSRPLDRRHSEYQPVPSGTPEKNLRRARSADVPQKREHFTIDMHEDDADLRNENWEIKMLGEELERRDSNFAQESLIEIQSEIKTLQRVLQHTDLDILTPIELKVLSDSIDISDKKIAFITQSSAHDLLYSGARPRSATYGYQQRQAFSLDSQDMDKRGSVQKEECSDEDWGQSRKRPSLPLLPAGNESNDSVFEPVAGPSHSNEHHSEINLSDKMLNLEKSDEFLQEEEEEVDEP